MRLLLVRPESSSAAYNDSYNAHNDRFNLSIDSLKFVRLTADKLSDSIEKWSLDTKHVRNKFIWTLHFLY